MWTHGGQRGFRFRVCSHLIQCGENKANVSDVSQHFCSLHLHFQVIVILIGGLTICNAGAKPSLATVSVLEKRFAASHRQKWLENFLGPNCAAIK